VALDLGGIAKGYVAQALAERLRARGIAAGAVLAGSSTIVAWGAPPGEGSWTVDVVDPRDRGASLCRLAIEPGAVSTSGTCERAVRRGREEISHVLDPRSGRPVTARQGEGAIEGSTVWTRDAVLGEVLSTALLVLGKAALGAGGPAERLVEAWAAPGEAPRASVLLVASDPGVWGGLRHQVFHVGAPGFRESD
jgi:thiamine biosynthesis lipoprotein